MSNIVFEHIGKRYGDGFEAVRDMNLSIEDGEFMILVGPSGCGKSTALRMVAGLEDITDGELKIGGEVVNERAPKDRDIAMVFQNYALYPHMTVRENMGFALKLAKTPQEEINRKVTDAAKVLDLEQHLDRKPANLSGGQRQRVEAIRDRKFVVERIGGEGRFPRHELGGEAALVEMSDREIALAGKAVHGHWPAHAGGIAPKINLAAIIGAAGEGE